MVIRIWVTLVLSTLLPHISSAQAQCGDPQCIQCNNEQKQCQRCLHYIVSESRKCQETCSSDYEVVLVGEITGNVCNELKNNGIVLDDVYILLIAVVCGGFVICLILAITLYCGMKRRLKRLKGKSKTAESLQLGIITESGVRQYDNPIYAYGNGDLTQLTSGINSSDFYGLVTQLKPYEKTLTKMWREAKSNMDEVGVSDPKISVYKNVSYHLFRVLTIVSNDDPTSTMATDGIILLQWAEMMLRRYILSKKSDNSTTASNGTSRNGHIKLTTFEPRGPSEEFDTDLETIKIFDAEVYQDFSGLPFDVTLATDPVQV